MFPSFDTLRVIWPPLRVSRVHSADFAGSGTSITTTPSAAKVIFQQEIIVISSSLIELLALTAVYLNG
jgi:hypothetical protein